MRLFDQRRIRFGNLIALRLQVDDFFANRFVLGIELIEPGDNLLGVFGFHKRGDQRSDQPYRFGLFGELLCF